MPFEFHRPVSLAVMSIAGIALQSAAAHATQTTKTIYAFCKEQACLDGSHPSGDLLMDDEQNLYGTTQSGGQNDKGTVYQMIFNAATGRYRHKVIYDFCNATGCIDGGVPVDGTLIRDIDGSLYGTTSMGGPTGGQSGGGVVFKLTPNDRKTQWAYSVVYNFCQEASCADGLAPVGGLTYVGASSGAPYDKVSPLYGVTSSGGKHNNGIVFSLKVKRNGGWRQGAAYAFCPRGGSCPDGRQPVGGLVISSDGVIAGTTALGGVGSGVAFKLNQAGKARWNEAVLHQFCSSENCADGKSPLTGLSIDGNNIVYGTTVAGGNSNAACGDDGCGVAFKIDTHNLLTQIHAYCSDEACTDGGVPARLSQNVTGDMNGLTNVGGANGDGTLYLFTSGIVTLKDFTCSKTSCVNGSAPQGGILSDADGHLFATMSSGGANGGGTLIKYTPPE